MLTYQEVLEKLEDKLIKQIEGSKAYNDMLKIIKLHKELENWE